MKKVIIICSIILIVALLGVGTFLVLRDGGDETTSNSNVKEKLADFWGLPESGAFPTFNSDGTAKISWGEMGGGTLNGTYTVISQGSGIYLIEFTITDDISEQDITIPEILSYRFDYTNDELFRLIDFDGDKLELQLFREEKLSCPQFLDQYSLN